MKEDLLNYCLSSKKNYKTTIKFLIEAYQDKLIILDDFVKINADYYKSLLTEKRFELSLSTTSAIKILNRPSSVDVYNKDIDYFSNPLLLMCYQLLFQISKVIENAIDLNILQVLELIKTLVLDKLNAGYGLGILIKFF